MATTVKLSPVKAALKEAQADVMARQGSVDLQAVLRLLDAMTADLMADVISWTPEDFLRHQGQLQGVEMMKRLLTRKPIPMQAED